MKLVSTCLLSIKISVIFTVALFLSACANMAFQKQVNDLKTTLPLQAKIVNIPFFAQEEYECGPAALAMALQASGIKVFPHQLTEQVFIPGRKGALQIEMLAAARRNGALSYQLSPNIETILREIVAGNPVIVFQNLSLSIYPVWHYAVVVGYDLQRQTLSLHSGVTENLEISFFTFEKTWVRGNYWAMLALSPDKLPVTAQEDKLITPLINLERVNTKAAQVAYQTALQQWPSNPTFLLGAGNTAYQLGQLQVAKQAYLLATKQLPELADAWNNLAQVLFDLEEIESAQTAIDQAVTLGGEHLTQYLDLKRQITVALSAKLRK